MPRRPARERDAHRPEPPPVGGRDDELRDGRVDVLRTADCEPQRGKRGLVVAAQQMDTRHVGRVCAREGPVVSPTVVQVRERSIDITAERLRERVRALRVVELDR